VREVVEHDNEVLAYIAKFTPEQKENVFDAAKYTGLAAEKTEKVVSYWADVFKGL